MLRYPEEPIFAAKPTMAPKPRSNPDISGQKAMSKGTSSQARQSTISHLDPGLFSPPNFPAGPKALSMRSITTAPGLGLAAALVLGSCGSQVTDSAETHPAFDFLLRKYDTNKDGFVSRQEYKRTEVAFRRLDRDGSGRLDEADFYQPQSAVGADSRSAAEVAFFSMFKDSEQAERLDLKTLLESFAVLDANDDGLLTVQEFRDSMSPSETESNAPEQGGPWPSLLAMADSDHDGGLSLDECTAVFTGGRENTVWAQVSGKVFIGPSGFVDEILERPLEGLPAPSVQLTALESGDPVELEDLWREKPIALIFGSYT